VTGTDGHWKECTLWGTNR